MRLRELLRDTLTAEELESLPSGFDVVGDIAILEIPDAFRPKETAIGTVVLANLKHVKVVVAKDEPHSGELRTRTVRHLAGEQRTTTMHKESGVVLEVDVESMYFSPRLSHERLRIASLIKPGERVLVMFSGCGPFPLVIARNAKPSEVVAVELNPAAHQYALRNAARNKAKQVRCMQGDVREVVPALGSFDRVVMPHPEGGEDFLDIALPAVKRNGALHFYDFLEESEIPQAAQKVKQAGNAAGREVQVLGSTVCGQIGVRRYRVCVDAAVE